MHAIEISGLTKEYRVGFWKTRKKRALNSLNLQVEQGEVFGLLGPNGAGKTTTLKILFRLIFPSAGSARILGRDVSDTSMHERVGYLPENPYFYDHLTAGEVVGYAGRVFGLGNDAERSRTALLLERVGLTKSRDVPLRKFSKGMVQRVGIAQALINNPDVIFLDEPMSGLDPLGRRDVRDLILQLRREGKTVFFSTHILSDAEAVCDRVAILNNGELQGCGKLDHILSMGTPITEFVIENPPPALLEEFKSVTLSLIRTGDRVRLYIRGQENIDKLLAACVNSKVSLISMNPEKVSLEQYFLSKVIPKGIVVT